MNRILVLLLLWSLSWVASAQTPPRDLLAEVESNRLQLESLAGNGGSSGAAIAGYLVNTTRQAIRVDVYLSRKLFLVNKGSGQNMVATTVYLEGGEYNSDGRRSFIVLRPNSRTAVTFIAYCADFNKDNPSATDRFTVSSLPPGLESIVAAIAAYSKKNPNIDSTVAAQAALWLSQGTSISEIRKRFPVSLAEERLAKSFLR